MGDVLRVGRPVGVWIVVIYTALNALSGTILLSHGIIYGELPARQGLFALAVSVTEQVCLLTAAAYLFMLRKVALTIYLIAAASNLVLSGVSLARTSDVPLALRWVGIFGGWIILIATIAYVALLYSKRRLT